MYLPSLKRPGSTNCSLQFHVKRIKFNQTVFVLQRIDVNNKIAFNRSMPTNTAVRPNPNIRVASAPWPVVGTWLFMITLSTIFDLQQV
jgi:hypothetical protein